MTGKLRGYAALQLIAICAAACALLANPGMAGGQAGDEAKPVVNQTPFTADELGIYHSILKGWMDDGKHTIHLSILTAPLDTAGPNDDDCLKGVRMEPMEKRVVHRFRAEDLALLGSGRIVLVDPDKQAAEVAENDPGKRIRNGAKIGDAVSNGFAHGLVTLGEIRFDAGRTHAIVWYGFTCGSLCGNGGTVVFEKKAGKWLRKGQCSNWIS